MAIFQRIVIIKLTSLIGNVSKYSISNLQQPQALRSTKRKSILNTVKSFVDARKIRVVGGKGGDGAVSFLSLWANEFAGPDGGDGGNGGHVLFKASSNVKDLSKLDSVIEGMAGEPGASEDCIGKSGEHRIIQVPIGTIVKRNDSGKVVGDLNKENAIFLAARGGAGGKGNRYFASDVLQSPVVSEYGAVGERIEYFVEIRSMAHVGLIGFPNAGKSTLLRAITRARPKVAPYPFTTQKPFLGVIQYDDYEQIAIADLPGLIPDSHKNRGLGIQFLRHIERCTGFLYIVDVSLQEPWKYLETLQYEFSQFNPNLSTRPQAVIANKIDLPESNENLKTLKRNTDLKVIEVSAKMGTNLSVLLRQIRTIYDANYNKNVEE